MSYFIIIRGPAGIGKSTIAEKLAEVLSGYHFSFDKVLEENGLDREDNNFVPEDFIKANEIVLPKARECLQNNKIVIFDGCFHFKEQIQHLIKNLKFKYYIFSLKASIKECLERNKTRKKPMTKKAIEEVYELVSKIEVGIEIETSGKNMMEVINQILKHLVKEN